MWGYKGLIPEFLLRTLETEINVDSRILRREAGLKERWENRKGSFLKKNATHTHNTTQHNTTQHNTNLTCPAHVSTAIAADFSEVDSCGDDLDVVQRELRALVNKQKKEGKIRE